MQCMKYIVQVSISSVKEPWNGRSHTRRRVWAYNFVVIALKGYVRHLENLLDRKNRLMGPKSL